jgi:Flp pilus assembly protein TadG
MFLLVLGMIEFGRMLMVQQVLTNGAREGARKAVLPGSTVEAANATIDSYLSNTSVKGHSSQVSPSPADASAGTPIQVTVSVPYDRVSWLPLGTLGWLKGTTLRASVEMRKEEF